MPQQYSSYSIRKSDSRLLPKTTHGSVANSSSSLITDYSLIIQYLLRGLLPNHEVILGNVAVTIRGTTKTRGFQIMSIERSFFPECNTVKTELMFSSSRSNVLCSSQSLQTKLSSLFFWKVSGFSM